ncbi:DNA-binding response regulator [Nocardioides sp. SLBN-35]|uniref:response regulator transcription factor n=1 Tax=Nocardioides sp. SLBN-35 TaxID=2768445 RepID=UPI0011514D96|nr:response regulator transcription factor [Nocardioides sp. SLBN-35]TQK68592.1 LuxR family two component transcriptional regulator [Nocardioides sp. SLBN-35]
MIRVLVAEDTAILRETLVAVLDLQEDIEVLAQAATGDRILALARDHRPDLALLDIDLPGIDGLTAAARLREEVPTCRVLILTAHAEPKNLHAALAAEVGGFLPKDIPAADLIAAIREVAAGGRVIDDATAIAALTTRSSPLTQRETDVLRLHAEGMDPREIAAALYLSYGTVRNYLASATDKLGAKNRIHAIRIATDHGWL